MKKILIFIFLFQPLLSEEPKFGISAKGGWFGIPKKLIDAMKLDVITIDGIPYGVVKKPYIEGDVYGLEFRYYGKKGLKGGYSSVLSYERNILRGEGIWEREIGYGVFGGTLNSASHTLTFSSLFDIFPSFPIHPFLGLGIGVSYLSYKVELLRTEGGEEVRKIGKDNLIIPVFHFPLGLRLFIEKRVDLKIETGFKNGFYFISGVSFNF